MTEDHESKLPIGHSRPGIPIGPRKQVERARGPNTRWPPYIQALVVVGVTVLFLVLAVSMQRHHFLNGEFYGRNQPADR